MKIAVRVGLVVSIAVGAAVVFGGTAQAQTCAQDVYTASGKSNALSCGSNDTRVASISAMTVTDPCTGVGDTATIQLQLTIVGQAGDRYDVGYYIALDGGDAYTGNCYQGILTPVGPLNGAYNPSSGTGPYLNTDGDQCGDIAQNVSNVVDLPPLIFQCVDADGNGQLDISAVTVWSQSAMDICNSAPALPGTSSKCEASSFASINVPVPTATPTSTRTSTTTSTATATATATSSRTNTVTQTPTSTATATLTSTPVNTATSTATSTNTPVNTATNTPVDTATNTPVNTATNTPVDTATNTPVNTATPTNTPVDTVTSTPVDTATATATSTNTPVNTATNTPVDTPTSTPVNTATNTPVDTPTSTPVNTATATPADTGTVTPVHTATATPSATRTSVPTVTATFEEFTPIPEVAPNIALFKSFPGLCRPSSTTTFTLQVRNIGGIATSGPITIVDPMPAGLSFVQATGNGWDCSSPPSTPAQLVCVRNTFLNAGATAPLITATVTVDANAGPVLINTAIATTPGDLDIADGTSTAICRRNPVPAPAASPWALALGLVVLIGLGGLALRRRNA